MSTVSGPLLLADAPWLLYRSYFALPDKIKGADGRPVNALLGAVNQLLQVIAQHRPRAVVACFGQESAVYRTEAFPAYHAARPAMPDDLAHQWMQAPALFEAFDWYVVGSDDHEADDLMGSLAFVEAEAGGLAHILTGDRDMFQCASERVKVLLHRAGAQGAEVMGPQEVEGRYGIPPELVPDFIALRGDPSDGIPGARGIGEKTAADLLRRHGSLEAAIAAAVREKPSVRRALLEQADELRMFRELATLRRLPLSAPPDRPTNVEGGAAAAAALGMRRLSERLKSSD